MENIYKPLLGKTLEAKEGRIVHTVSVEVEDRDGDVVRLDGGDFKQYRQNPVVLYMHGHDPAWGSLPIGRNVRLSIGERKGKPSLEVETQFALDTGAEFVRLLYSMYARGYLRAWSIGFRGLEVEERESRWGWTGREFKRWELYEYSAVPIPANPQALTEVVRDGLATPEVLAKHGFFGRRLARADVSRDEVCDYLDRLLVHRSAVPFQATPTMDRDAPWDGAAARDRLARWASSDGSGNKDTIDWAKYAKGFLWYDGEQADNFGAYKLPHHDVVDGVLKVNFRGCAAALVALRGGRGGVDIPDADVARCEAHLARHYQQFDIEFPERGMNAPTVAAAQPEPTLADIAQAIKRLHAQLAELRLDLARLDSAASPQDNNKQPVVEPESCDTSAEQTKGYWASRGRVN